MQLRHAVASVAVTTALIPCALLTVSPAFADDTAGATPSASDTAGTPAPAPSDTVTTAPSQTATPSDTPTPSATPSTTKPTPTTTPTADPTNGSNCAMSEDPKVDDKLSTTLDGLPSKITAGSGWHSFTLHIANSSATSYKRVDFGVFAAQLDSDGWNENTDHLTLQYQDEANGSWHAISLDEDDYYSGYLGYSEVAAHATLDIKLRLNVDAKAPAGEGYALAIGIYADDKGNCVISGGDGYYPFRVLAAGAATNGGGNSQPTTGGEKPVPPKPAGNTDLTPHTDLAETGSSSTTPAIAATGGAIVLLGAGTLAALRRRNGTPTSH